MLGFHSIMEVSMGNLDEKMCLFLYLIILYRVRTKLNPIKIFTMTIYNDRETFSYCKWQVSLIQTLDLLEDRVPMKDVLKFIIMDHGEQCVTMPSMQQMQWLFADNWGTHHCKYGTNERYQAVVLLQPLFTIAQRFMQYTLK